MVVEAMGGACYRCGETRLSLLTLHHRDPSAKTSTVPLWRRRLTPSVWAEIWLCDLLCHNCHALEHAGAHRGMDAISYRRVFETHRSGRKRPTTLVKESRGNIRFNHGAHIPQRTG